MQMNANDSSPLYLLNDNYLGNVDHAKTTNSSNKMKLADSTKNKQHTTRMYRHIHYE